jgi:membrane protease YdiL (CAAX protease family)
MANVILKPVASGFAIFVAALVAGLLHSYQGRRAMVIVTQLSVLFGVLFVLSGYNLWAVVLCHGMYDTVAFVRYAFGKSKYSRPNGTNGSGRARAA